MPYNFSSIIFTFIDSIVEVIVPLHKVDFGLLASVLCFEFVCLVKLPFTLLAVVSLGEDAGREKPLRANDRFFVEHAQNYITSLPVISRNLRQKIMSVTPVSSPKRDSKQNCKIVISSPRTPTKIQCRPAGKYCVVCKLNFKPNDTFYSLSRSGILTTLNTILETNILPAIQGV